MFQLIALLFLALVGLQKRPSRRMYHVPHGTPYHIEDSLRGIRLAIAKMFGWIDLDCHVTKNGVLVITHWPRPMEHDRFFDPEHKIKPSTPISEMTWEEVSRLRTKDGYRIHKAIDLIAFCQKHGIKVELEMKDDDITVMHLQRLWNEMAERGLNHSDVQVKAFPQFIQSLLNAKKVGWKVILLTHERGIRISKARAKLIDYYHGFKPVIEP